MCVEDYFHLLSEVEGKYDSLSSLRTFRHCFPSLRTVTKIKGVDDVAMKRFSRVRGPLVAFRVLSFCRGESFAVNLCF